MAHRLYSAIHTALTGQPPSRAEAETTRAVERLLTALADGIRARLVREGAWTLAENVRRATASGRLDRAASLRCYDLVGETWSACDRMDRTWGHFDRGEWGEALTTAAGASANIDALEADLPASAGTIERLRAYCQALWQLADGLEEALYLSQQGDHRAARARATAVLRLGERLVEDGLLSYDELLCIEDQAARFGARPPDNRLESWAS